MADADIFTMGSVVCVTPAMGSTIQGEVMAFDHKTKILVLSKFNYKNINRNKTL